MWLINERFFTPSSAADCGAVTVLFKCFRTTGVCGTPDLSCGVTWHLTEFGGDDKVWTFVTVMPSPVDLHSSEGILGGVNTLRRDDLGAARMGTV